MWNKSFNELIKIKIKMKTVLNYNAPQFEVLKQFYQIELSHVDENSHLKRKKKYFTSKMQTVSGAKQLLNHLVKMRYFSGTQTLCHNVLIIQTF